MIIFKEEDVDTLNQLILNKEVNEKELVLLDKLYTLIKNTNV